MLIDSSVYFVFAIGVPILLAIAIGWATFKKWGKYGVVLAILASAFGWAAAQTAAGHMYIVDTQNNVLDYRTFGAVEYQFANGTDITFEYDPMKVLVINNSPEELILEELKYYPERKRSAWNIPTPEGDIFYIGPFSSEIFSLPHHSIDFLPGDYIPKRIEEYGSANSKYWLHR